MGDLLIEDRDGCMHDPIKTAEMLDGYADHASAGMDDSLYDAADVMRGLVNRLDDAEARAADARGSIADAIEAARQRGVCVERDGEPKTLLVVVSDIAHDLIGLRGAYDASSRAIERLRTDLTASRVEVDSLRVAAREVLRLHDAAKAGDSVTTREVGAAHDALRAALAADDGTVQA